MQKVAKNIFIALVFAALLAPLVLFSDLLYPFTTSKAFFLRTILEIALPFYLYLVLADKNFRPSLKHPLTLAVIVFFAAALVSAIFGKDFIRSFWGNFERMDSVFALLHFVALYFYILLLAGFSVQVLEKFFRALVWVSAVSAINGIVGFLGGPTLTPDISLPTRASSVFCNPIFFASFLVLPMFLSAFFAEREEARKLKIFYWAIFALHLLAIFFSGTRGVAVGLAGGLFLAGVFYLILEKNRKIRLWSISGILAVAMLAGVGVVFSEKLPENLNLRRLFTFKDSNTQARLIHWKMALQGFKENPFLGVGPNNYYVVSNQHYNLKIWQYDRSWFDKPHNYQLELLSTYGILGFLAYLAIIVLSVWVIYRAHQSALLNLGESALLLAGFLAYQIQNLFVFDTVSASLAFYIFLGFIGYLWNEANDTLKKPKFSVPAPGHLAGMVMWLGLPVMLYIVFALNITGYKIARALNIAKVFQTENFDAAKIMLDKAVESSFNFYWKDTAYEYSNFAAYYSNRSQPKEQQAKSLAMMQDAIKAQYRAVEIHRFDPTVWMKLANALFAESHLKNSGWNQEAYDASFKAHTLAPKKHDPKLFMAEVAIEGKQNDLAEKWLLEVLRDFPDLQGPRWQLADVYYFSGQQQEAERLAVEAIASGFLLDRIKQGDWLLTFYYENRQPQKAVEFLFTQAKNNGGNSDYFARLADAYNKSGRFPEARAAALKLLEIDPSARADVEAFLSSLPAQ